MNMYFDGSTEFEMGGDGGGDRRRSATLDSYVQGSIEWFDEGELYFFKSAFSSDFFKRFSYQFSLNFFQRFKPLSFSSISSFSHQYS